MQAPELLLNTLEDLTDTDLHKFQFFLTLEVLDERKPFPRSHVDKISRHDTVSKMIEIYGDELAVNRTVAILKKMLFNNAAMQLEDKYKNGAAPSSNSSSAVAPPSASGGISAQQGAVVISPVLKSSTIGDLNITINQHK